MRGISYPRVPPSLRISGKYYALCGSSSRKWYVGHLFTMYRAICYDETIYPLLHKYDPEWFLKDRKLDRSVKDPEDCVFGTGRQYDLAQAAVLAPL